MMTLITPPKGVRRKINGNSNVPDDVGEELFDCEATESRMLNPMMK